MSPQSTFMQIDLQNLFFAARNKGQRIDFEKIWEHFHSRENEFLTDAYIYMIRGFDFDTTKFERKLQSIGYKLSIKQAEKTRRKHHIPPNHCVNMTIDCLERVRIFDKWILIGGGSDFLDLCKYVKDHGKKTELWGFKESHSSILEPYVDRVHFIEEEFFYKRVPVSVFGPSMDIK